MHLLSDVFFIIKHFQELWQRNMTRKPYYVDYFGSYDLVKCEKEFDVGAFVKIKEKKHGYAEKHNGEYFKKCCCFVIITLQFQAVCARKK